MKNRKSCAHRAKGVVDIEFIMAVVVFLGSISFVTLTISREFFSVREAALSETMKLRSNAILQLLLFDRGFPENWESGPIVSVRKLGLSSGNRSIIETNKVSTLNTFCSSAYEKVKDILGVKEDIILTIKTLDGSELLNCKPAVETLLRPKFPSEGYAVMRNTKKIVKFTVMLVV